MDINHEHKTQSCRVVDFDVNMRASIDGLTVKTEYKLKRLINMTEYRRVNMWRCRRGGRRGGGSLHHLTTGECPSSSSSSSPP